MSKGYWINFMVTWLWINWYINDKILKCVLVMCLPPTVQSNRIMWHEYNQRYYFTLSTEIEIILYKNVNYLWQIMQITWQKSIIANLINAKILYNWKKNILRTTTMLSNFSKKYFYNKKLTNFARKSKIYFSQRYYWNMSFKS